MPDNQPSMTAHYNPVPTLQWHYWHILVMAHKLAIIICKVFLFDNFYQAGSYPNPTHSNINPSPNPTANHDLDPSTN